MIHGEHLHRQNNLLGSMILSHRLKPSSELKRYSGAKHVVGADIEVTHYEDI